jgi:hypothetical protein
MQKNREIKNNLRRIFWVFVSALLGMCQSGKSTKPEESVLPGYNMRSYHDSTGQKSVVLTITDDTCFATLTFDSSFDYDGIAVHFSFYFKILDGPIVICDGLYRDQADYEYVIDLTPPISDSGHFRFGDTLCYEVKPSVGDTLSSFLLGSNSVSFPLDWVSPKEKIFFLWQAHTYINHNFSSIPPYPYSVRLP